MSRGRVMGIGMIIGAILFIIVGGAVAFDDAGDSSLGLPILVLGIAFLIGGGFLLTLKPKPKIRKPTEAERRELAARRKAAARQQQKRRPR